MSRLRIAIFAASLQFLGCAVQEQNSPGLGNLSVVVSPGGSHAAVVSLGSTGGGAVGSSILTVHLGRKRADEPANKVKKIFEGLHSCDLEVSWESDTLLSIQYSGARCNIRLFKNFWYDPESVKVQRPVRIEIVLERK